MQKEKAARLREARELLIRALLFAGVCYVLLSRVFLVTQAHGNDMFPSVRDGDLVVAFRLERSLAKNDVVVYSAGGKQRVGRVAAAAGDVVYLDDSGALLVNGVRQTGEILYPTYAKEGLAYPLGVPEGQVFLLGDYRTQGEDSRDFGPISQAEIRGKVITILRRRGL